MLTAENREMKGCSSEVIIKRDGKTKQVKFEKKRGTIWISLF